MRIQVTLHGDEIGIFDPDEFDMDLAMQLEDKTGMTILELGRELSRGSSRSLQALVWILRLKAGDSSKPLHQNFKFGDIFTKDLEKDDPEAGDAGDPPLAAVPAAKPAKAA